MLKEASLEERRSARMTGAQGVREILGEYVTVQIAKRSELHTFMVILKRWVVERSCA